MKTHESREKLDQTIHVMDRWESNKTCKIHKSKTANHPLQHPRMEQVGFAKINSIITIFKTNTGPIVITAMSGRGKGGKGLGKGEYLMRCLYVYSLHDFGTNQPS